MNRAEVNRIPLLTGRLGTWHLRLEREACDRAALEARYDRLAGSYERRLRSLGFDRAYRGLAARIANAPVEHAHEWTDILDCGCGSGELSAAIATGSARPPRVSLLDLSKAMLEVARDRLTAQGIAPKIVRGDVRRLPLRKSSFDLVLAGHVLEHLANPTRALAEMRRVLRPGGRLLVVVTRRSLLGLLIQLRWRVQSLSEKQLRRSLLGCGFSNVRFVPVPGPWWCSRLSLACLAENGAGR